MQDRSRSGRALVAATLALFGIPAGDTAMAGQDPLRWGPCPPSVYGANPPDKECTNVSVPLDYSDPGGRRIDVAVSRRPATSRDKRRGVLLLAAGGPGNAGLDLPDRAEQYIPASVREHYDLIGFDARGTGRSTPLTCGLGVSQLPPQRVIPWPDPRGFDENVAYARFLAQSCGSSSTSDLVPFITTENRARDIDRIRAALGEGKISYYGYSYSTYVGAVYLSLFLTEATASPWTASSARARSGATPGADWDRRSSCASPTSRASPRSATTATGSARPMARSGRSTSSSGAGWTRRP
jgi:hypothetical protein